MKYEDHIKRTSRERVARHIAKHRRFTLDKFNTDFGRQFGSSIDMRMNKMYDLLFSMRDELKERKLLQRKLP